ncbi:MAG: alpha/beta hydrolase [Candidatus Marinimicrobia bacterium]|nr:alpha/beta hydrolase [Candidatus Neomarinimicrobiota bacterium]
MNFDFDTPYGNNETVGKYINVNGIRMYYEEYGEGEPLFLIHPNGGSISSMGNQIDHFRSNYYVITADSRGHGKSELNTDSLTYDQIAEDWAELANQLNIDSLYVIGWSDGGIVGLLMGINYPDKVKKIVTMGSNLRPDSTALYPWAINSFKHMVEEVETKIKENEMPQDLMLRKQQLDLLIYQPSISKSDLSKIKVPVLIIAGDKDVVREEHSIEIYQNIPKALLCIMPGETHFTPASNAELFNEIALKFIVGPFKRPDSDWTKW